jgi:hypothetical protein
MKKRRKSFKIIRQVIQNSHRIIKLGTYKKVQNPKKNENHLTAIQVIYIHIIPIE